MAAVILHRTVFLEHDNRSVMAGKPIFRPTDFALVQTPLGLMVEPFNLFEHSPVDGSFSNYDSSDEMRRVDQIDFVDLDKYPKMLSNNDPEVVLHGGNLVPKTGR